MPPKTEDKRRSRIGAPLSAEEELAVQCRVNPGYEYTSEDINLIMRARNIEQGIGEVWTPEAGVAPGEDERARFSGILFHKENRDIVDEAEMHSSVPQDRFVRNERGGFVVQWPSMALTGAEANSGHTYICESLRDIMAFAAAHPELNPYPLKILFPYNPSRGHWVAGEIILGFDDNRDLVVQLSQYNPMSNLSAPLDRNFQEIFLENYRLAIGDADRRVPIRILPTKIEPIGRKENGRSVAIQRGGLSCGVFATYALDKLKTKVPPSKMWDDFPYDGSGAERQRRADVAGVHGMLTRGVISNKTFSHDFGPSRLVMRQDWVSEVEFLRQKRQLFRDYLGATDKSNYAAYISPETIEEIDRYETLSRKKIWLGIFQDKGILRELAKGQHPEILDIFAKKISLKDKQDILERILIDDGEVVAALVSQLDSQSDPSLPRDPAAPPAKPTLRRRDAKSVMQGILSDTATPESDDYLRFNESLAALDLEIQKNIADKETLNALLLSIVASAESEIVKQAMAERLIAAGATVAEAALPTGGSSDQEGLVYTLYNEYYLSLLQTATLDEIRAFSAKYTNLDLAYTSIKDGMSALHYAVQNRNDDVLLYLLEQEGIDVDAVDHYGRTPLILATMQGNYSAVKDLVAKDANVRLRDAAYKMSADQWAQAMADIEPDGQREKYDRILEFLQTQVEKPYSAALTVAEKERAEAILYAILMYCDAVHSRQIESTLPSETIQAVGLLASDAFNFVLNNGVINEDTEQLREYDIRLAEIAAGLAKLPQLEEFLDMDEEERAREPLISDLAAQIANSQGYPTTKTAEEELAEAEAPETPIEEVLEEAAPPRAIPRRELPPQPPKEPKASTIPEMPSLLMGKGRVRKAINHSGADRGYNVVIAAEQDWIAEAQRIKAEALEHKEKIEHDADMADPKSKKFKRFKDNHPKFSLNRSDFFSEARKTTEIDGKKVKAAANLRYVLITPEELSFVACNDYGDVHPMKTVTISPVAVEQDEKTYVKLSGTYQDILQPDKILNPSKAFQPYYANFGGMVFQEKNDGNKIFGKACLFAANFRNCVFDNVDLSQIPPDIFATIEFNQCNFMNVDFSQFSVATLACMGLFDGKFDNCAFNGCIFPDGFFVDNDGKFKLDASRSAAAAHILDSWDKIVGDLEAIHERREALRHNEGSLSFEDRESKIVELRQMIEGVTVFAQVVKEEAQNKEEPVPGARPSSRGGDAFARPISREGGDSGLSSPVAI